MLQLPMFPGWDGIHPLLIHFPLTLFFLAPVFALMAAFTKAATRRAFLISTLLLMVVGTVLTYVAFEAGEAAAAEGFSKEALAILERHKELADLTRSSFTLATKKNVCRPLLQGSGASWAVRNWAEWLCAAYGLCVTAAALPRGVDL